jgi:hypothetical protein
MEKIMGFVIYHASTTRTVKDQYHIGTRVFKTESAAKAARTRLKLAHDVWLIAEARDFAQRIEKTETKRNLMGGGKFTQSVNTPLCCDPSSETYWSM